MNDKSQWQMLERFLEMRTPWLTLIGEKLLNEQQQILDYWRVEKADSVVIVTIHKGLFLLPIPSYRPGVGKTTLDFPGGRVQFPSLASSVSNILRRELGVNSSTIDCLTPLNNKGWAINSSFSNQKLYGFIAEISPNISINSDRLAATYPTTKSGTNNLLKDLTCLQCRAVLLEWWRTSSFS